LRHIRNNPYVLGINPFIMRENLEEYDGQQCMLRATKQFVMRKNLETYEKHGRRLWGTKQFLLRNILKIIVRRTKSRLFEEQNRVSETHRRDRKNIAGEPHRRYDIIS
jgi:hypothetical protein